MILPVKKKSNDFGILGLICIFCSVAKHIGCSTLKLFGVYCLFYLECGLILKCLLSANLIYKVSQLERILSRIVSIYLV